MTSGPYSSLLRLIRKVAAPRASESPGDSDLLDRFIAGQDETAFAALVRRHGPMVFGVCRNVLGNAEDAEDAFQATFVVLVRKARSISKRESLGSWLHGVAYRVALKARSALARRRTVERQAIPMSHTNADAAADTDALWRDLRPVLHEEVERLPARYRDPFVLCYLEGKTNEEAAAILGWPKGTVLSSLARARERLRERLTRRGLTLSAAALAAVLSEKAAPAAIAPALLDTAVKSGMLYATGASASLAAPVLAYADAVTRSMFLAKLKLAVVGLLACGILGAGTTVLVVSSRPSVPPSIDAPPAPLAKSDKAAEVLAPPRVETPDRDRLPGTWVVVGSEQNGKPLAPMKGSRLKLMRDSFEMDAPRSELRWIFRRGVTQGAMQFDSEAQPKTMKLVDQVRTLRAIYRFDGDRLLLLVADPDVPEPLRDFATIPADRRLLLTLQRE
jgi:RNA polymerase sigma factor (sigma-70 family)